MSISDLIVVMKDGKIHQIGKPQEVYDDPINLFVATFLGTPPINVFDGRVEGEQLFIGSEAVLKTPGVANQAVTVAVRPEGFDPDPNGSFTCALSRVEVMGRDISLVCRHDCFTGAAIRAIVDADHLKTIGGGCVRFTLAPNKVFLFRREDGSRIRFEG